MIQLKNRARPIRLSDDAYRALCAKVLERDGWKCQDCGRRDRLQIHHILRRSQSGMDCKENLMVLCSECHHSLHLMSRDDPRSSVGVVSDTPT